VSAGSDSLSAADIPSKLFSPAYYETSTTGIPFVSEQKFGSPSTRRIPGAKTERGKYAQNPLTT